MSEILKPCPFCGEAASIERYGDPRQSTIYQCDSCSCRLETGEEWDHGKLWNRRSDAAFEERDRLREENRAYKVLLESKDETIRQLTEERAEQWRQRRDAEGSRDAARAAADSLRIERDALREAMEGIVHFSDALNFRNDHLSKALSQWIEAGRKLLSPPTAEGREP